MNATIFTDYQWPVAKATPLIESHSSPGHSTTLVHDWLLRHQLQTENFHNLYDNLHSRILHYDIFHTLLHCSTLAATDSKSIAIVILEGNAWGLMMRSGRMPVFPENGISTSGHNWEHTPFCPCLLLNLSPITGFRGCRKRMLTCSK